MHNTAISYDNHTLKRASATKYDPELECYYQAIINGANECTHYRRLAHLRSDKEKGKKEQQNLFRHEALEKVKMRRNTFQSTNDIINGAIECTHNRRLSHLPSANEESMGVTETPGGWSGVGGEGARVKHEPKTNNLSL